MTRRILITGATGQIGRWLCHRLLQQDPTAPDKLLLALRDPARQLGQLRQWLGQRGIEAQGLRRLQALPYELDQPACAAALVGAAQPDLVYHLAARFAWGLPMEVARRANVSSTLALAEALQRQRPQARLVHLSGFMLQHRAHLQRLGISAQGEADWPAVYRRAGGYEASKLEAHFRLLEQAGHSAQALLILHPATVAGHSQEGELPAHAALYQLGRQLLQGRLAGLPGSAQHRLPLVAVDYVAGFAAALALAPELRSGEFLLMDGRSPPLPELVRRMAAALGRTAPRRQLPKPLLRALLSLPGMAALSGSHRESLDFVIEPGVHFDTASADALAARWGLRHPSLEQVLDASARHIAQGLSGEGLVLIHSPR